TCCLKRHGDSGQPASPVSRPSSACAASGLGAPDAASGTRLHAWLLDPGALDDCLRRQRQQLGSGHDWRGAGRCLSSFGNLEIQVEVEDQRVWTVPVEVATAVSHKLDVAGARGFVYCFCHAEVVVEDAPARSE